MTALADRLAAVSRSSTCHLTHRAAGAASRTRWSSERVRDAAEERHVMDLVVAKYWDLWPAVALARLVGYDPKPDASFRVRLAA